MFRTIILAAGKGTRMKSDLAKVLHHLRGKPLLRYVVSTAKEAGSRDVTVIIGHQADAVREACKDQGLEFVEQSRQLGTGHAVLQAREKFDAYSGNVLILCGDVPLLRPSTVHSLITRHIEEKNIVTVLTALLEQPTGYGRIIKGPAGEVLRIVEEKDATAAERRVKEINTGIYCVSSTFLFDALDNIKNDNVQQEYYLTDIVAVACNGGYKVGSLAALDRREVMGINSPEDLEEARQCMEYLKSDSGDPR